MVYFDDELIRFGDALVCGQCKPLFVQKLREGVTVAGEMVYAGFWIRFLAKLIDGIILAVVGFVLGFLGNFIVRHPVAGTILENLLSLVLSVAYQIYFLGAYSATPGKMACGLKVVRSDNEKLPMPGPAADSLPRYSAPSFCALVTSLRLLMKRKEPFMTAFAIQG